MPLPIGFEPMATLDNYLAGANALALAQLKELADAWLAPQGSAPAPLYVFGPSGSGKTHVLRALARPWLEQGARVAWFAAESSQPWEPDDEAQLLVLDDCHAFTPPQQQAAFSAFVDASSRLVPVLAAGLVAPAHLLLRADLSSRLGWGHVVALSLPSEPEVRAALQMEASRRGLLVSDEVMAYVLTHFERDLKHLMQLLDRLDQYTLARKRPLTVPLLKTMLAEEGRE